jgi:hypothetical protein
MLEGICYKLFQFSYRNWLLEVIQWFRGPAQGIEVQSTISRDIRSNMLKKVVKNHLMLVILGQSNSTVLLHRVNEVLLFSYIKDEQ